MTPRSVTLRCLLLGAALALVALPREASASACCMSTSVSGVGRLAVWEQAAAGLLTSYGHATGRSGAQGAWQALPAGVLEDDLRFDGWALLRLHEDFQLSARAPWLVGVRAGGDGATSLGTGVGDVSLGLRWDALQLGEYAELPGVALVLSGTAPTGRRPEDALNPLGADATGRGAWSVTAGFVLERAVVPWFVRLDGAATLFAPFRRSDTGQWQQFGPGLDLGLSGGRELVPDVVVLAALVRLNHEWPVRAAGAELPDSAATSLTASLSASWKVTPHWTLTGAVATDALARFGLAQNRPERLSFTVGVRHGFF